jgi:hypothetical protein
LRPEVDEVDATSGKRPPPVGLSARVAPPLRGEDTMADMPTV